MTMVITPADLDAAARTVYGEIRGYSYECHVNVARVMVNRVLARHRKEVTLMGVVTEPYQFSCWLPADPNYRKLTEVTLNDRWFRVAHRAVLEAIDMRPEDDRTKGSLHYLTPAVQEQTSWARGRLPIYRDEAHLFFNDVD